MTEPKFLGLHDNDNHYYLLYMSFNESKVAVLYNKSTFKQCHLCALIPLLFVGSSSSFAKETDTNEETMVVEASRKNLNAKEINLNDINNIRGTNNADIFGNETSLQINNSRNEGGAIDVGIRGLQGNGRVPIVIDGSLQSTNTWRGYQGSSDRTYIDMDLIESIRIEKGVSKGKFSGGAIGGTIKMKTIGAENIVPSGDNFGMLFKGNTYNNNRRPNISPVEEEQYNYKVSNGVKGYKFNNGSITAGLAYINDEFDFLLAHSERYQGNYFAGKHGYDKYAEKTPISPGQEVVNTSYESHSSIVKIGGNLNPYNRVEFNLRRHEQNAGEVLAAYWSKSEHRDDAGNKFETMPQWSLGTALINTASANYTYKPDSILINLDMGAWWTKGEFTQFNGNSDDVTAMHAEQYRHTFMDERKGINISNTSSLSYYPFDATYGLEFMEQRIVPLSKRYQSIWSREGITQGKELQAVARNAKGISKSVFLNTEYNIDLFSIFVGWRVHDFDVNDFNEKKSISYQAKNDIFSTLTYHLSKNIDIYTKYSDTYRNPSLFESSVSGQTYSYSPKFPLKPENSKLFELGVELSKQDFLAQEDTASVKLNYFNNKIDNYISQGVNPKQEKLTEPYIIMKNYDSFKISGYEIEANYDSRYFFGGVNSTLYNTVEFCSQNEMNLNKSLSPCNSVGFAWSLSPSRTPPLKNISTIAGLKLFDQKLQAGMRVRYNSGKEYPQRWLQGTAAAPIERQYASTTIDLFGKYNIQKGIDLYLNVDNLTNRYAFDPGAVIYMPIPGRTFRLGIEAKF